MTKEFGNLIDLLNTNDTVNNSLGFNIAQNYKKEFKEYFGYTPKIYEIICKGISSWKKNVTKTPDFLSVATLKKISLQNFAEWFLNDGFYDKRFAEESQCGGWKQLKNQVKQKVKLKDLDLTGIHTILKPHIKKYWYLISKLNIENNK